jgi:hypothetical protein
MAMPNLFIPGAGKSGTSSLHEYLKQHSKIYMSSVKEPHFFSGSGFPEGIDSYRQLFETGKNTFYRGESSTAYMIFPKVVERIKEYAENPKFIFVLRNPIDRAYSHYWWLRGQGFEGRTFRQAVEADMFEEPDPENLVKGFSGLRYYFQEGCYAKWIKRFLDEFGHEQIHVITAEELRANPLEALNGCAVFLGIEPFKTLNTINSNTTIVYKFPRIYRFIRSLQRTGAGTKPGGMVRHMIKGFIERKESGLSIKYRREFLRLLDQVFHKNDRYPRILSEDRCWLRELYSNEVDKLRELSGLPFDVWKDDFNLE